MQNKKTNLSTVINKIKKTGGEKINFIILYGSTSEGKQTPISDIDIAVYYEGNKEERFNFRMKILGKVKEKYDIQTYQDLPLYIKKEIITKGKILYQKNHSEIFNIFIKTIKNFGDFKPRLDIYYAGLEV